MQLCAGALLASEPAFSATEPPSKVRIELATLLLDGRGEREQALEVFKAACDTAGPSGSALALLAGFVADSLGDHAAASAFYEDVHRQYNPLGHENAALHLMLARTREGDEASASKLRATLPDHMVSSAEYVLSTPVGLAPSTHFFSYDMLRLALSHASLEEDAPPATGGGISGGLVLEFGVYHGKSIRQIARYFGEYVPVHGFDTFSGIPTDWHNTVAGTYSTHGALPPAPENVQYHVGLFSDTLPPFLAAQPANTPIRLMNVDCDLYESTKDIFDAAAERIVPGTVIIFDEYVCNPNWEKDEYRAFQEAVEENGWRYRYLAISLISQQAIVQIV